MKVTLERQICLIEREPHDPVFRDGGYPMENKNAIARIELLGREWFRKSAGNSYQTVEILINDKFLCKLGPTCCYGDHYETLAIEELNRRNLIQIQRHPNGSHPALWRYCEENKIKYTRRKIKVSRERDL